MHSKMFLNPIKLRGLTAALVLGAAISAAAGDGNSPQPAAGLMNEVVANELTDRVQQHKWIYRIEKQEGNSTLTEEQVDTNAGPFYRLLAIDGKPLDSDQRKLDNARMDRLLKDPGQQLKSKRSHDEDELMLENLMRLMPDAFLYDYDGVEGPARLTFHPNPSYNPPTYEARMAHNMAGTILIDPQQKRLAKFSGEIIHRVEFGFGFLGHIDQGGTIEFGRIQVRPSEWKTATVHIQMTGRLVLFKTVNKQQHETRSDFRGVPDDISLLAATKLLVLPIARVPVP